MLRRFLLAALLVYVTLDLSLAAMPGAFVFDVAESVESAKSSRGREAADVVVRAEPTGALSLPSPLTFTTAPERLAHVVRGLRPTSACAKCLPRAALATVGPSTPRAEDPH